MFPFISKKSKQKKILQKIKVKQETMRKLEEEIEKMARLALKDGKLVKTDEPAPQQQQQPPQMPPEQLPIEEYGNETIFDAMPPPPQQPMPMRVPPPPQMPPRPRGRPPMQPQQQTYQPPQQQTYQPPQQQYQPQPQYQQYQPPQPQPLNIQIVMINGQTFTLAVIPENLDAFIAELTGAIANRTVFIAGKHGISGSHIAWYIISEGGQ